MFVPLGRYFGEGRTIKKNNKRIITNHFFSQTRFKSIQKQVHVVKPFSIQDRKSQKTEENIINKVLQNEGKEVKIKPILNPTREKQLKTRERINNSIKECINEGKISEAEGYLNELRFLYKIKPNEETFQNLILTCEVNKNQKKAEEFLHKLLYIYHLPFTIKTFSYLIRTCKTYEDALEYQTHLITTYQLPSSFLDSVEIYKTYIGLSKSIFEANSYFKQMIEKNISPDIEIFLLLFKHCEKNAVIIHPSPESHPELFSNNNNIKDDNYINELEIIDQQNPIFLQMMEYFNDFRKFNHKLTINILDLIIKICIKTRNIQRAEIFYQSNSKLFSQDSSPISASIHQKILINLCKTSKKYEYYFGIMMTLPPPLTHLTINTLSSLPSYSLDINDINEYENNNNNFNEYDDKNKNNNNNNNDNDPSFIINGNRVSGNTKKVTITRFLSVIYNCFVQNDLEKAERFYSLLISDQFQNITPPQQTFSYFIALAINNDEKLKEKLFFQALIYYLNSPHNSPPFDLNSPPPLPPQCPINPNLFFFNDFFKYCHSPEKTLKYYKRMIKEYSITPTITTFSNIFLGCNFAKSSSEQANFYYKEMIDKFHIQPNARVFKLLFELCKKNGEIGMAQEYYHQMTQVYNISHYYIPFEILYSLELISANSPYCYFAYSEPSLLV